MIYALLGVLLVFLIGKLITVPLKIIFKLVINGLAGALMLFVFNYILNIWNINLPITPITCLLTGIIGIPFVLLLVFINVM